MALVKFLQKHWAVIVAGLGLFGLAILVIRAVRMSHGSVIDGFALLSGDRFLAATMLLSVWAIPALLLGIGFALFLDFDRSLWSSLSFAARVVLVVVILTLVAVVALVYSIVELVLTVGVAAILFLVVAVRNAIRRRRKKGKTSAGASGSAPEQSERGAIVFLVIISLAIPVLTSVTADTSWVATEKVTVVGGDTMSEVYVLDDRDGWFRIIHADGTPTTLLPADQIDAREVCSPRPSNGSFWTSPIGVRPAAPLPRC